MIRLELNEIDVWRSHKRGGEGCTVLLSSDVENDTPLCVVRYCHCVTISILLDLSLLTTVA